MKHMGSGLALTFHRLCSEDCDHGKGPDHEVNRYTVSTKKFRALVDKISPENCCTVSEFSRKSEGDWLMLTFDDGLISDFEIAYPILAERGIKGTFFITCKNVGRVGHTSSCHLMKIAEGGMEIGSHGLTHRYLVTMSDAEVIREIMESKDRLEQRIGFEVQSFAAVGGHFHKWMLAGMRDAGYRVFATMIPGRTIGRSDFLVLKRNHIQAKDDLGYMSKLLAMKSTTLVSNHLRYRALQICRVTLGMDNYDRIRKMILKGF